MRLGPSARFSGFYPVQVKLNGSARRDARYQRADICAFVEAGAAMAASQTVKEALRTPKVSMIQLPEALAKALARRAPSTEVDAVMRGLSDTAECRYLVAADDRHGEHATLWQRLYDDQRHLGRSFEMAQWNVYQALMQQPQLKKAFRHSEPVIVRPDNLQLKDGRPSFTVRVGFLNRVFTQQFSMALPAQGALADGLMITEKAVKPCVPPVTLH